MDLIVRAASNSPPNHGSLSSKPPHNDLMVQEFPTSNNSDQSDMGSIDGDKGEHIDSIDVSTASNFAQSSHGNRTLDELIRLVKIDNFDPKTLTNDEIIDLMSSRQISIYKLETILGRQNAKRCVEIRRLYYKKQLELLDKTGISPELVDRNQESHRNDSIHELIEIYRPSQSKADVLRAPQNEFDYDKVVGACCENVIGFVRLPVGLVGPLKLDGQSIYVPLATTEGCLVASTSRGLSALAKGKGVISQVKKDCMTRAPIIRFNDTDPYEAVMNVHRAVSWLQDPVNKDKMKAAFGSGSRYTKLMDYTVHTFGETIHIRFEAQTGDAMGMNMCSKGAENALKEMQKVFPTMDILTLSGNMCADKKPSAINLINGRGKSVECNALISAEVVEKVLKVDIDSMIESWSNKVMLGSAMAGSVGGYNCHAANIVAAIFIATGQDAAQVVSSSNCIIRLKKDSHGNLFVSCSMPSIECGTVGGGTVLSDQSGYLQLMGIKGPTENSNNSNFDTNACKLSRIICSTVMAAELSLLASLTEGTLVKSHMTHNRSAQSCNLV